MRKQVKQMITDMARSLLRPNRRSGAIINSTERVSSYDGATPDSAQLGLEFR